MKHAYLDDLRNHLLEEGIVIPKGIVTINEIVRSRDDSVFSDIIIEGSYIAKKYFEGNAKKDVYDMLIQYCKDYIKDYTQVIKIKK